MVGLDWYQWFMIVGLILDIIGVWILYVVGLPERIMGHLVDDTPFRLVGEELTPEQIEHDRIEAERKSSQEKRETRFRRLGISTLITGFILQGVGVAFS